MENKLEKIIPHLWYDKEAKEAANFYVSVFGKNSKIQNITTMHDTPSGDADVVSFKLFGQPFQAISAGPYFKFNPSISFIVNCESREEIDRHWKQLSEGGNVLMPLEKYPFSERYGWLQDRYGLSWQLSLSGEMAPQRIIPSLLFVGEVYGKAEEAIDYYWDKLSAVPEAEQCGWLKDKFGVSWQVVSSDLDEMMIHGTKEQVASVTQAFLKMKKFDIAALREAYTNTAMV